MSYVRDHVMQGGRSCTSSQLSTEFSKYTELLWRSLISRWSFLSFCKPSDSVYSSAVNNRLPSVFLLPLLSFPCWRPHLHTTFCSRLAALNNCHTNTPTTDATRPTELENNVQRAANRKRDVLVGHRAVNLTESSFKEDVRGEAGGRWRERSHFLKLPQHQCFRWLKTQRRSGGCCWFGGVCAAGYPSYGQAEWKSESDSSCTLHILQPSAWHHEWRWFTSSAKQRQITIKSLWQ